MPRLIDTHAHLDNEIYRHDLEIVIKQALQDEVWMVTVGSDFASSQAALAIAEKYPIGVYAAIGLHPRKVSHEDLAEDKLLDVQKFHELASHPKVIAIGETGLDFSHLPTNARLEPETYHVAERIRSNQKKVFGHFLQLSQEFRLPLLLHCRDAHDEMLEMIETWDKTSRGFDCRGIIHHFSGTWKQARRYFNLDFMISVTGLLTHGGYLLETLKKAPLSRLVLESDCPHLTTTAWNLRRSEPSYLHSVAAALAGIRGEKVEAICAATTQNALKVLTKLRPEA